MRTLPLCYAAPLLIMFTFSLIQVPRVASAGVHHEAPVEGQVGQGSRLHAQDLHPDEETMGVPHLPVRPASPTSKSLPQDSYVQP